MELSKERLGLVTASSVGAILGLSPHRDREAVMRAMVREWHGAESEFTGNVATEYGTFHESGAKVQYEMETGNTVIDAGFFKYQYWLGATPDGMIENIDEFGNCKLLEIKCPYGLRDEKNPVFKTALEQPHYYAQMQIQMFCADCLQCDFYQWAPHGSKLETVAYDEKWIDENLPILEDFYNEYLIEREHDAIKHLQVLRPVIDDHKAKLLIDEYDQLSESIDMATARKKEVLQHLVKMAKERNSIICNRLLTKVEREGAVSYAKALEHYAPNADVEPFRGKPSEYWKLS